MAYLSPFIVRQCCSCRSLCGDCTENTLKKNTAQCCELFRLAQHCKMECRFLKWASGQPCKKRGTISLLICWWHTCFISPQTTETSQISLVPSWPAASSIYMKLNHDSSIWPLLPGGGSGYVFSCVSSLSLHLVVMSDCLFSIHVALNSLALFQALIPLLPGSKFILSADLICDQNLRLHLTLHAPLLRWSSSLYNQICPFCWSL